MRDIAGRDDCLAGKSAKHETQVSIFVRGKAMNLDSGTEHLFVGDSLAASSKGACDFLPH